MCFHYEKTPELWHRFFKTAFLGYEMFEFGNKKVNLESSTSFDNMDQEEFSIYFKKIETWLLENGLKIDDLLNYI
jgi:hypothetical protein